MSPPTHDVEWPGDYLPTLEGMAKSIKYVAAYGQPADDNERRAKWTQLGTFSFADSNAVVPYLGMVSNRSDAVRDLLGSAAPTTPDDDEDDPLDDDEEEEDEDENEDEDEDAAEADVPPETSERRGQVVSLAPAGAQPWTNRYPPGLVASACLQWAEAVARRNCPRGRLRVRLRVYGFNGKQLDSTTFYVRSSQRTLTEAIGLGPDPVAAAGRNLERLGAKDVKLLAAGTEAGLHGLYAAHASYLFASTSRLGQEYERMLDFQSERMDRLERMMMKLWRGALRDRAEEVDRGNQDARDKMVGNLLGGTLDLARDGLRAWAASKGLDPAIVDVLGDAELRKLAARKGFKKLIEDPNTRNEFLKVVSAAVEDIENEDNTDNTDDTDDTTPDSPSKE